MTLYTFLVRKGLPSRLAKLLMYGLLVFLALPSVHLVKLPELNSITILSVVFIAIGPELKSFMYYKVFTRGKGYISHRNDYRSITEVLRMKNFWSIVIPGVILETLAFRGTLYSLALEYLVNFNALLVVSLAFGIWLTFIANAKKYKKGDSFLEEFLDHTFAGFLFVLVYAISGNLLLSFFTQLFLNAVSIANNVRWKEVHLVKHKDWIMVALAKPGVLLYASRPPRLNGNISFDSKDMLYAVGFTQSDAYKVAHEAVKLVGYDLVIRRVGW
ncbi:MAG: type II CAAX prenyl endopeptidase Rce1 family protein [Patescibacteria group bacterium]